jgi:hypothetical protein
LDISFTDSVYTSSEDPGWQHLGVSFNVDQNRESSGDEDDCLVLWFENASHVGGSDNVYLSRGSAHNADYGTTLYSQALTGDAIEVTDSDAPNYLHLKLDLENSVDNTKLNVNVLLTDPADNDAVKASWTLTDLDYAADLMGAAYQGEIGVICANDNDRTDLIASKNSIKWDNFQISEVPEPGIFALCLIGLVTLIVPRMRRQ